ncbi:MAG: cation:proton antiporter [Candidatus Methylarchaceae archaeon HK01B]|nr:cation:proton antiporter [Candidatus Methylarchaceae archaeon HK02M1]MCP8319113.1 cation:proton antiporter [Candidatus Methylarchaceae archaeon HK01B]
MDAALAFILTSIIIIIGFLGNYFFRRTGIPDLIILILIGALVGPVFGLIDKAVLEDVTPLFTPLAIAVILFDGGLNLNLYGVLKESPRAVVLASLSVLTSVVATTIFTVFVLNWEIVHGLLLGSIIGGSSSAIVIPLASRINVSQKVSTILSLESTFTDAICIVIALALLQFLTFPSQTGDGINLIIRGIASGFSIGIVVGFLGGILWQRVLSSFTDEPYGDILTLALALLIYGLTEETGGNGAISALVFGLVLGNEIKISETIHIGHRIETNKMMKRFHSEISFVIRTFFFTYMGIILLFNNLLSIFIGVMISLLLLLMRYGIVLLSTVKAPILKIDSSVLTVMIPRGLAAAVLVELFVESGIGGELTVMFQEIVLTVIISTVLICTIGISLFKARYNRGSKIEKPEEMVL